MKSYSTKNFSADSPAVVALGCFDGVHKGHTAVIKEAVRLSRELSLPCAVFTFENPPRNYFHPNSAPTITDRKEKQRLMRSLGVDILICIAFDRNISSLTPQDFFEEILVRRLRAAHLVCGFNYSFGVGGAGNISLLQELCSKRDIGITCLPPVEDGGVTVSSSTIRQTISQGEIEKANRYLGRPFAISAKVVNGQHLARKLGFPTVNQILERGMLLPRRGVYVTRIIIGRKCYFGITNVGIRPTVSDNTLCAESHIFDFSGNLYGKNIRVEFLKFLRPEIEFSSVEALAERVRADIESAKLFIAQIALAN